MLSPGAKFSIPKASKYESPANTPYYNNSPEFLQACVDIAADRPITYVLSPRCETA